MSKRKTPVDDAKSAGYSGRPVSNEAARGRAQELQKTLRLSKEGPVNPDSIDFAGAFASLDLDNSWDPKHFKNNFKIHITKFSEEEVSFDMVGIDPPFANAFRRILLSEVPTVAISQVTMWQNTGVIHDENLAHRLGLLPLRFDPEKLDWKKPDEEFNDQNCLKFKLHVICDKGTRSVYSKDLVWEPMSKAQKSELTSNGEGPAPVADNILITQLRPGQEIECECYCEKGLGKTHAKWSPVSTAWYRLLPKIEFSKDIKGEDAEKLVRTCPMKVFDVEDLGNNQKRAVVKNARACTTCRQCLEAFPGEEKGLLLGKVKDHYLFTIESTGSVPATDLFEMAVKQLKNKCQTAKDVLTSPSFSVSSK